MTAGRNMRGPELPQGVVELDHTADVGMTVEAASLEELFRRAAAGMLWLMWERKVTGRPVATARRVALRSEAVDTLLVRWLRELLYLHEVHGFVYREATFDTLTERRVLAEVSGLRAPAPVREFKGVTYHELRVGLEDGRWRATVIFDV